MRSGAWRSTRSLSFLSILWAGVAGDAWEGANRTLLYLLVFALFALWPQRARSAALLLGAWTLAMIGLAVFVVLHVDARSADRRSLFGEGRLAYPGGYQNAAAAHWLMVAWPALLLARSERLPWWLRGLLCAGGAVLLADLALLSQSRGSLYATPVMLVLVFALIPARMRTFATARAGAAGVRARRARGAARGRPPAGGRRRQHHAARRERARCSWRRCSRGRSSASAPLVESRRPLLAASSRRTGAQGRRQRSRWQLALLLVGGWAAAGNPVRAPDTPGIRSRCGYAANGSGQSSGERPGQQPL